MDLSNENVIHIKKEGIEYLQFRKLLEYQEYIKHAYSIGVNRNFKTVGPDKQELPKEQYEKVLENYKDLCTAIGIEYNNVIKPNQDHTDGVKVVKQKINKDKPDINVKEYDKTDGLITNTSNTALVTTNADCILLLFFDPVKKVIANVHSGWKGTLQRISVKTVEKMKKEFGSEAKDIICCICPSIRKCHFEVEKDVKDMFQNEFCGLHDIIFENSKTGKWHIDTVLINKIILEQVGLLSENIIDCGICSVCNSEILHSFRVEKQDYGVCAAIVCKEKEKIR